MTLLVLQLILALHVLTASFGDALQLTVDDIFVRIGPLQTVERKIDAQPEEAGAIIPFVALTSWWKFPDLEWEWGAAEITFVRLQRALPWWKRWLRSEDRLHVSRKLGVKGPALASIASGPFGRGPLQKLAPFFSAKKVPEKPEYRRNRLREAAMKQFLDAHPELELPHDFADPIMSEYELAVGVLRFPFQFEPSQYSGPLVPPTRERIAFQVKVETGRWFRRPHAVSSNPQMVRLPDNFPLESIVVDNVEDFKDAPEFGGDHLLTQRPVYLAIFDNAQLPARDASWKTRGRYWLGKSVIPHWEVHVGNTAFYIHVKDEDQKVHYRPVTEATKFFGGHLRKKIFMCTAQTTNTVILRFLKRNWKGPFCILNRTCHEFSRMLIDFLCTPSQHTFPLPKRERLLLDPLRKVGLKFHKPLGGVFPLLKPFDNSDEWEFERFEKNK